MTVIQQRFAGSPDEADRYWMKRALAEARLGRGATSPNPPVGAMLVKDNQLLAQGHHARAGGPHAEIACLGQLINQEEAKGATLYVTLEPCSTHGRTPPCTQAILDSGIARVVYASRDPNPDHAGRADAIFQKAGIEVKRGLLEKEGDALIRVFRHWIFTKRPYIVVKAGLSLDGRLTRPPGEGPWLTSPASRHDAQRLRVQVDAILTGAETIRKDDPSLTIRHHQVPHGKRPLKRVILTNSGRLPQDAQVFTDALASETIVLENQSWPGILKTLADQEITSVLIEGGGDVLQQVFREQLVNEVCFYLAPLVSGGGTAAVLDRLSSAIQLEGVTFRRIGDDVCVSGYPVFDQAGS